MEVLCDESGHGWQKCMDHFDEVVIASLTVGIVVYVILKQGDCPEIGRASCRERV